MDPFIPGMPLLAYLLEFAYSAGVINLALSKDSVSDYTTRQLSS